MHNLYNIYMYNCVWSDDAWTCLFMVGGDDPIKTDENVKDCLRALALFLNIILCCSCELDIEYISLDMSSNSWSIKI